MLALQNRARLAAAALARIQTEVQAHSTLERVVHWALSAQPAHAICQVVKQDEFTQDVVVHHAGALHLVYDST
jgi:hypothetical protein